VQGVIAGYETPRVKGFLEDFVPAEFDLLTSVLGPIKDAVLLVLNTAGSLVPTLINIIATGAIDALIFLAAIVTFYMEGPRLLQVFANLSPMDDSYEGRLFDVFKEFATNLVLGSLATAVLQGIVASIGYLIVGVDGVIFFGLMTALFSFVPVVGTVLVWLPLSLAVGIDSGWMWGGFLIGWSVVFTGTVDNLVKPLFLRGSSNIHPLLIFLAVFGGLAWMHLPGILVGPVLVAFFLSLYTIYCEDYLGISNEIEEAIQDACAETVAEQQGLNSNGDIDDDADTVDVEA
jgi:predicted PurR-regulated permease PerM